MKYRGINLTNCVQVMLKEKYKTLRREIKDDLNKQSYTLLMMKRLNMLKMSILLKLIH